MKKTSKCLLIPLILMAIAVTGCASGEREDILITDFEGKDYNGWEITGEAFGQGPAQGKIGNQRQVTGYKGIGLANSFFKGNSSLGILTSPPFTIERSYINFLIGGGNYPGETCINLLVDGNSVRTATGGNDEHLSWSFWDVTELKGESARIQIVDKHTERWGHVNVDDIIQSDMKSLLPDLKREILIGSNFINLPVKTGAEKRRMKLIVDGSPLDDFEIELADNEIDFWAFIDVEKFMGKKALFRVTQPWKSNPQILDGITQSDAFKGSDNLYREKYRPQFHFTSRRGWNNDPNGLVYYKGEYHLFYQHNPYGWNWGNMHWGHAVSTDLVHWKDFGDAIYPDELGTIFSGSAVVDWRNTAGFQSGDEKVIVCFYTSAGSHDAIKQVPFTQSIAYSNDRCRTLIKYEGNPVIGHIINSNRDPKIIWHEQTNKWVMALYLMKNDYTLFTSPDLKEWKRIGDITIPGCSECPDIFELPVDGDPDNKKWVFWGANGSYVIGKFDGTDFKPEGDAIRLYDGGTAYAAQSYSDIPQSDGRRIQISWLRCEMTGMPFNQQMGFPVELTLRTTDDGIRMFSEPVREIENIYGKAYSWKSLAVAPGENPLSSVSGDLFDIRADITVGKATECGLNIRGIPVIYNTVEQTLSCQNHRASLKPKNGCISLRIIVDRTSIEIFGNDGLVYMPIGVIPEDENKSLEVFSKNGNTRIESLEVYELASVWE